MKEHWKDSEPRLSVGSGMKTERKLGRVWEDPDVWSFGEQLGLVGVGSSLVISRETL